MSDKRTANDLIAERRAAGAAIPGGRIVPDGQGGLAKVRHDESPDNERRDERPLITREGVER